MPLTSYRLSLVCHRLPITLQTPFALAAKHQCHKALQSSFLAEDDLVALLCLLCFWANPFNVDVQHAVDDIVALMAMLPVHCLCKLEELCSTISSPADLALRDQ